MTKSFLLAATATILLGAGWPALTGSGPFPFAAAAQEAADPSDVTEMTMGDPEAAVTVIEYASFTCPHCRNFHDTVFPELKAEYIDTGKIEFVYREVYFDRFGLWAGMVARCGGPERYFGISDLIYDQQQEWVQGEPEQIAQNLRRIGKTAGLDDAALDACLSDTATAEAMVARFEETTEADEITATPSFVIDGEKFSNMSYEDFSALLDERLAD